MLETIYYKTKTILPLHVSQHTVLEITSTIFHIYIGHCNHAVEERRNSERRNAEPNRKDDVITREWEQEDCDIQVTHCPFTTSALELYTWILAQAENIHAQKCEKWKCYKLIIIAAYITLSN